MTSQPELSKSRQKKTPLWLQGAVFAQLSKASHTQRENYSFPRKVKGHFFLFFFLQRKAFGNINTGFLPASKYFLLK